MQPVYTLLYDGACPLCTRQAKAIAALDTHNHIALLDLQNERVRQRFPHITPQAAQREIHLVAPDGTTTHRGAEAVRQTLLLLPLVRPAGLLMYLPGAMTIARPPLRMGGPQSVSADGQIEECEGGTCQPFEGTSDR